MNRADWLGQPCPVCDAEAAAAWKAQHHGIEPVLCLLHSHLDPTLAKLRAEDRQKFRDILADNPTLSTRQARQRVLREREQNT